MDPRRPRKPFPALGCALAVVAGAPAAQPPEPSAEHAPLAARSLLIAVAAAGPRLVAVGDRGVIVLSDDRGRTWAQALDVPTQALLRGRGARDRRRRLQRLLREPGRRRELGHPQIHAGAAARDARARRVRRDASRGRLSPEPHRLLGRLATLYRGRSGAPLPLGGWRRELGGAHLALRGLVLRDAAAY
ncbi:MAG: hypothetical protein E6K22_12255 [Gammaproteobacteria bacterium]|nr:MAG: hypothetical protein E6K22_12255 [Gammaproteobacteria bacterium]